MTKSQKNKLYSVFDCTDTEIISIHALDFLIHTWDECDNLAEIFGMIDVREIFGDEIYAGYMADDQNLDVFLWKKGGVFIFAKTYCPQWESVKFGKDGKLKSYSRMSESLGVWAPDYDRAICKLAAKVLKIKNAEIKKARKAQGIA